MILEYIWNCYLINCLINILSCWIGDKNWPGTYLPGVQNFIFFSIFNNKWHKKKLISDWSVA